MTWRLRLHSVLAGIIVLLLFLIPLIWSREVNANYYTTKTTALFLTGGLCFLYLAFTARDFKWSRTTHWLGWVGVFFIVLQVAYSLIFNYPLSLFFLPKFFAFVGIIFFLIATDFDLALFIKKYEWLVLIFFVTLVGLTVANAVDLLMEQPPPFPVHLFIVPFGNVNMMGEFYLLSIPIVHYWMTQKNKVPYSVKLIIFILINLILLPTQSRSVFIAQSLWWMYYFYSFVQGKKKYVFMALTPLFFYGITQLHYEVAKPSEVIKIRSSDQRKNFYLSTLDLVMDKPLGSGLQYSNIIVPYRLNYPEGPTEYEYPDQPHSEILKWAAELGVPAVLLAIVCLIYITWLVCRRGSWLLKGALLMVGPQVLVQFPFENPATVLWMALFFYLVYRMLPAKNESFSKTVKLLSVVVGGLLVWHSYIFIKSIYYTSHYPTDYEMTKEACEINPIYMPSCIMKNYNLLFAKRFDELKQNLRQDMKDNYYNVDLLKIVAAMLFETSKVKSPIEQNAILRKTCEVINIYTLIFKTQIHFAAADIKSCQGVPKPFDFHNPMQFDEDYRKWMEKLLSD